MTFIYIQYIAVGLKKSIVYILQNSWKRPSNFLKLQLLIYGRCNVQTKLIHIQQNALAMRSQVSISAYAPSPWLLQHRLSLYKARFSSCRTLSLDKPNMLPISNSVFSLPSSIPNRSLIIRLSFGLRMLRRFRICLRISSLSTLTSGVSTSESAVISCNVIQNAFSDYGREVLAWC